MLVTIDIYNNVWKVYSERQVQDAIQQFTQRNKNISVSMMNIMQHKKYRLM